MATNAPLPDFEQLKDDLDHRSRIHPDARTAEVEATDCSICAEPIFGVNDHSDRDGAPRRVRCGHLFHYTCILQWVDGINPNRNRCPNCRDPLCKLNLLDPDKEAQWQAEEYARTYVAASFSVGIYSNLMELVDIHFSRQRYVWGQRHREDWVRIISEVRSDWIRGGCEGMRCCKEHERMEWDWFEFEVAKRVWDSLLRAGLTHTPKARLFSALFNAMDDNLQVRWFGAHRAGNNQPMQDAEEDAESGDEVVGVPRNGGNAMAGAQEPANNANPIVVVGAQESANNAGEGAVPGAREPANAVQNAETRVQVPAMNADDRVVIPASDSGSTVSSQSSRSERQQQGSGSPRPIPVFRSKPRVQQEAPLLAPVSDVNMRRHNANPAVEVDDNQDYDSDEDSDIHTPLDTPSVSWRGPLQSARSIARTAFGSAASHHSASTRRSRRPTIRTPAVRRQDRFDDARHDRELRHLQQSEVLRARRRLEEQDHIVLDVVQNVGQVLRLGNMDWLVMARSNGQELCKVSGAIGYQFVGETAIFYRNKI